MKNEKQKEIKHAIDALNQEYRSALAHILVLNRGLFHIGLDYLGSNNTDFSHRSSTDGLIRSPSGYYRLTRTKEGKKVLLFSYDGRKLSGSKFKDMERMKDVYVVCAHEDGAPPQAFQRAIDDNELRLNIETFYKLTLHTGTPEQKDDGTWMVPVTNGQIAYTIEQKDNQWVVHLHTRFDVEDEVNETFVPAGTNARKGFGQTFHMPDPENGGERTFPTPGEAMFAVFEDWNKRAPCLFAKQPAVGANPEEAQSTRESIQKFFHYLAKRKFGKRVTVAGVTSVAFTVAAGAADPVTAAIAFGSGMGQEPIEQIINRLADMASGNDAEHALMQNQAIMNRDISSDFIDKTAHNWQTRVLRPLRADENMFEDLSFCTMQEAGIAPSTQPARAGYQKDWIDRFLYTAPFRIFGGETRFIHKDCLTITLPNGVKWMMVNRNDGNGGPVTQTDVYVTRDRNPRFNVIESDLHDEVQSFFARLQPGEIRKISHVRGEPEFTAKTLTANEFHADVEEIVKQGQSHDQDGPYAILEMPLEPDAIMKMLFEDGHFGVSKTVENYQKHAERVAVQKIALEQNNAPAPLEGGPKVA